MAIVPRGDSPSAFFGDLYAVVLGLGLVLGVEQVVDLSRDGIPVSPRDLALFFAYLNFAFALAHASVRYLQLAYGEEGLGPLRKGRVVADLILGIGHFLLLIALPLFISRPSTFLWTTVLLLLGRPVRDWILRWGRHPTHDFDRKVAAVHLVCLAFLILTILIGQSIGAGSRDLVLRAGAVIASVLFGMGSYLFAFEFFFPSGSRADPGASPQA
jgi:hypothetical protein